MQQRQRELGSIFEELDALFGGERDGTQRERQRDAARHEELAVDAGADEDAVHGVVLRAQRGSRAAFGLKEVSSDADGRAQRE